MLAMLAFVIAFFAAVLVIGPWHMKDIYRFDFFDAAILGFATFRLIRLVTFDKIFGFVRAWFMDEREGTLHKPHGGFRRLMAELIECVWCTGLWAALFVTTAYVALPFGRFFVIVLAIAAMGTFLQNISKAVTK